MKKILLAAALLSVGIAASAAPKPPAYGLSGQVVHPPLSHTQTDWLLEQQANSQAPKHSEITANIYVDTQKRIVDTFKQAIPDKLKTDTTDVTQ